MTRIITPELNKKLKKEYTFRFLTILFFSISIVFLVHVAFAASSYMLLSSYENLYQSKLADNNDILRQNEEFIAKIDMLDIFSKQFKFDQLTDSSMVVFDAVQGSAGEGILINVFELYKDKDKIKITLRGLANTREDLVAFDTQIRSDDSFSDFLIPIDAFTKQTDINFDVTFTYNEK